MAPNLSGGDVTPRMQLERQYTSARFDLLLVVAFTVINLLMLVSQTFTYFLFSANFPYLLVDLGLYFGGMYTNVDPSLFESGYGMLGPGFFWAMLAVAIVIVCAYFVCWLLSSEGRVGWLIAALTLFAIDTLLMLGMVVLGISEPAFDFVIDLGFHAYVIYALAVGVRAHYRLTGAAVASDPAVQTADVQD